ncbi:hypothetical protein JAAARDRAFT_189569 [Jaapia argillacea MUCL 33604]|uniref:Uncharacterized protein n=1 Tax=Jaapia argillacea MUCL 33604 TaxID=933084 RepID=A0A067Q588_9AGAM|nr:hypothetical protein JAAARDRAFT_189569 [Jaapia argillacea MUCL 33604]
MNFKWPEPLDPATEVENNPHLQTSQRGKKPKAFLKDYPTEFTHAVFPRTIILFDELVGGIAKHQLDIINQAPDDYLAVIIYGAGASFFTLNPNIHLSIKNFITSLNITDSTSPDNTPEPINKLDVDMPVSKMKLKKLYGKPWTLILSGTSPATREYLLWQQTFAVNPKLTFSVIPFDRSLCSWVIMNLSGDAVKEGCENEILTIVKRELWASGNFRGFASQTLEKAGIPGSPSERTVHATNTLTID